MKILLTGAAGFIGHAVAKALLARGESVIGVDNINSYYDITLKHLRLKQLERCKGFSFHKIDICDYTSLAAVSDDVDLVIHMAAQAGVRYSLENPFEYVRSNINGFLNVLEVCRHASKKPKLIYASSSSVYGANTKVPFSITDSVKCPISLYAATKLADEHMAFTYNHLYGFDTIGLRFFTVYGEHGRPDMAPYKFTTAILAGEPINVYNYGKMKRDFTYIDDIVTGVFGALGENIRGNRIYNLGNNKPVELMHFIKLIEKETGCKAILNMLPIQPGEVLETCADIKESIQDLGFNPKTSIEEGTCKLVAWIKIFGSY